MNLLYLDTETTGLAPNLCAIVQIAAIHVVNDTEVSRQEFLLQPFDGAKVEDKALQVNGRTHDEIRKYPPWQVGWLAFKRYLSMCKATAHGKPHLCGYNISFDWKFLEAYTQRDGDKWFFKNTLTWPPLCTMTMFATHYHDHLHRLPDIKQTTVHTFLFDEPLTGAHDAMKDVEATRRIFTHLKTQIQWPSANNTNS